MTVSFDDFWDFSILSNLKNFMNSMKNYGQDEINIIYDIYIIYESVKQIKFIIHIYESSDFFLKIFKRCEAIIHSALILRKERKLVYEYFTTFGKEKEFIMVFVSFFAAWRRFFHENWWAATVKRLRIFFLSSN